ncbi:DEAD/DEAH box helicase [Azospirillum sp. SYSU D00513]|uniref:DEAD/DEAH box helicase n=1 Tax=Azospirillum sp. SYSU D00513 TaxID=2812561 RepID=UPI001A963B7A|nr:DEAD/DEAH box helicase [Azospirillum sp. SYSU D00513]
MARRVLRPYQQEDRDTILAALRKRRNPLYKLPTGAGKTAVFSDVADIVSGAGWPVMVLTHRFELLSQTSQALHRNGLAHGLIFPGRMLAAERVYVASIDTLAARLEHYGSFLEKIRLVIPDECHHSVCTKYMRVFDAMDRALRLGVTATPFRSDGTGLGTVFDTPVEGPGMAWLTEQGYLAPVDIYAPPLHLDLRKVPVRAGDYVPTELERILDNPEVTEPAVQQYAKLAHGRPTVVFCVSRRHCRHVAEQFEAAGYAAAPVDGKMPDEIRAARLRGLVDGTLQIVVSCEIVSEGTDLPGVECGIMLRPTKSTGMFLQQGGRLTRLSPGKSRGILIDMVGNTLEHGMLDEDRA